MLGFTKELACNSENDGENVAQQILNVNDSSSGNHDEEQTVYVVAPTSKLSSAAFLSP